MFPTPLCGLTDSAPTLLLPVSAQFPVQTGHLSQAIVVIHGTQLALWGNHLHPLVQPKILEIYH